MAAAFISGVCTSTGITAALIALKSKAAFGEDEHAVMPNVMKQSIISLVTANDENPFRNMSVVT
jgi:hypothetical protein